MLEKMHDQHAQDKVNDRMETGSFPTVRKKPRKDLNRASNKSRLLSSILIALMCALLGFAYMSQINNTKSTYETMDESELVRLLNESNTQISNLEQRKTQLNSQLNSLKSAANEQEQARKIAKQNEETSGLISGRLPEMCIRDSALRFAPGTGQLGMFQGAKSYLLETDEGQTLDTYSISAGLDYASVGPEHAWLKDIGRVNYS